MEGQWLWIIFHKVYSVYIDFTNTNIMIIFSDHKFSMHIIGLYQKLAFCYIIEQEHIF